MFELLAYSNDLTSIETKQGKSAKLRVHPERVSTLTIRRHQQDNNDFT